MYYPDINQNKNEIVGYDFNGIPLYIRSGSLSQFTYMGIFSHWHEDIEFIFMQKGSTKFKINKQEVVIKSGDCLMINSRQMHYNEPVDTQDAEYLSVLVHPSLFAGNPSFYQKYILSIMNCSSIEFIHWKNGTDDAAEIKKLLNNINDLKQKSESGYLIAAMGFLYLMWQKVYRKVKDTLLYSIGSDNSELPILRNMLSYIHQHYNEHITIIDISMAGGINRSKCSQMFLQNTNQSPIEFVNTYRLFISCTQLKNTNKTMTSIAYDCGFPNPSYYSKLFLKKYHCTPGEFRKRYGTIQ